MYLGQQQSVSDSPSTCFMYRYFTFDHTSWCSCPEADHFGLTYAYQTPEDDMLVSSASGSRMAPRRDYVDMPTNSLAQASALYAIV
jgi:hypothetical protein